MKVLVVGLDGLEYNLVVKWNMRGLMQQYYGKHDVTVAVKPGDPLYTPFIWASFLLGRPSYELGFSFSRQKRAELQAQAYHPILRMLFKLRVKVLGYRPLGLRKLLMKMRLYNVRKIEEVIERYETMPPELVAKTFIAEAERRGYRVWFDEFPSVRDLTFAKQHVNLGKLLDASYEERIEFLREAVDKALKDFEAALEKLDSHDLVLYYTAAIDEAHHLIYRPGNVRLMTFLRSVYGRFDKAVRDAKEALGDSVAILVVSDHGYDPTIHDHSTYGFWSMNIKPPIVPQKIIDFYNIILGLLEAQK